MFSARSVSACALCLALVCAAESPGQVVTGPVMPAHDGPRHKSQRFERQTGLERRSQPVVGDRDWLARNGEVGPPFSTVWSQSDYILADSDNISEFVSAEDFVIVSPVRISDLTVWLTDDEVNDDGVLGSFSGTLSWAIYQDDSGDPGVLVGSWSDAAPTLIDTGFQDDFDADLVEVRAEFDDVPILLPGTYWLAIHEGEWQSEGDGSTSWWAQTGSIVGQTSRFSSDETDPTTWSPDPFDHAFVLSGDALDQEQDSGSDWVELTTAALAQSFVAGDTELVGAGALLGGSGSGVFKIELWDGLPNAGGTKLTQSSLAIDSAGWVDVFWDPMTLEAGRTHYLVFTGPPGFLLQGENADVYPSGNAFFGPGFQPGVGDFAFRTWSQLPYPVFFDDFESGELLLWSLVAGTVVIAP